jgi:CubicO group peptidase (beta-lactamase class C family)
MAATAANIHSKALLLLLLLQVQVPGVAPAVATPVTSRAALAGSLDAIVEAAIAGHAFPGAVALVANRSGVVYSLAAGNFTYGDAPPPNNAGLNPAVSLTSLFDLASLTKVLATTTATMLLYQRGLLDLETLVASSDLLGPSFALNGKGTIRVLNLLLHNAGCEQPPPVRFLPRFVTTHDRPFWAPAFHRTLCLGIGSPPWGARPPPCPTCR